MQGWYAVCLVISLRGRRFSVCKTLAKAWHPSFLPPPWASHYTSVLGWQKPFFAIALGFQWDRISSEALFFDTVSAGEGILVGIGQPISVVRLVQKSQFYVRIPYNSPTGIFKWYICMRRCFGGVLALNTILCIRLLRGAGEKMDAKLSPEFCTR